MILRPGETPVGSEAIHQATGPGPAGPISGELFLTSQRLMFSTSVHDGAFGAFPKTILDLDLSQITSVAPYRIGRDLVLRVEAGPHFGYTFATPNAQNWANVILSWRTKLLADRATFAQQSAAAAMQAHAQRVSAKPLVFLHCRHCGTLNPVGSLHCGSCGAGL